MKAKTMILTTSVSCCRCFFFIWPYGSKRGYPQLPLNRTGSNAEWMAAPLALTALACTPTMHVGRNARRAATEHFANRLPQPHGARARGGEGPLAPGGRKRRNYQVRAPSSCERIAKENGEARRSTRGSSFKRGFAAASGVVSLTVATYCFFGVFRCRNRVHCVW